MIADFCEHNWTLENKGMMDMQIAMGGSPESKFRCIKCGIVLMSKDVYQLENLEFQSSTLKHLKGFQTKSVIASIIVSIGALIVSIIALLK